MNHSSDGVVAEQFLYDMSMVEIGESSTGFFSLTRARYCDPVWCLGHYAHHSKLSIAPMDSDEISESERSCLGGNDKDLRLGYSILPLGNGIGLRRRSSILKFHYEHQDRLRPTSVEAHERQCKGKSGREKSPGELYGDHS